MYKALFAGVDLYKTLGKCKSFLQGAERKTRDEERRKNTKIKVESQAKSKYFLYILIMSVCVLKGLDTLCRFFAIF